MHIQGHTNKIKNAVKIRVKDDGRLRKLLEEEEEDFIY